MKKRRIIALFLVLLTVTSLFAGCGIKIDLTADTAKAEDTTAPPAASTVPENGGNTDLPDFIAEERKPIYINNIKEEFPELDDEIAFIFSLPDDYEELPPSSYDLIRKDFEEGKLTREKAAMFSVLAQYDKERLPEEYRSDREPYSAQFEIRYLLDNWNNLSGETRNTVEPYLMPISDPRSYFNPNNKEPTGSLNKGGFVLLADQTDDPDVEYIEFVTDEFTHDGQTFFISYWESSDWSDAVKILMKNTMALVKNTIINCWDKFCKLMKTKPSKRFDIELLELGAGLFGVEFTDGDKYRIRINSEYAANTVLIKSTTAHELFHTFQEELGLQYYETEEQWLCEACAVWAENYAHEDLNFEHIRHPGFFSTLEKERIYFGNCFEYESYMLFYYLTDYAGDNIIYDITKHTADNGSYSVRDYLENRIPAMKEKYAEFARFNWNLPPLNRYNDHGPIRGNPNGACLKKKMLRVDEKDKVEVSLEAGGIQYYFYAFDTKDEKLSHVIVTFEESIEDHEFVKRQALIRIDGKWRLEDWSGETYKEYCRRREGRNEKIEALLLIYSNAGFKDMLMNADTFEVRTEKCPKEMNITMRAEFTYDTPDFLWETTSELSETIVIKDHCLYLIETAQYNFSGQGHFEGQKIIDTSGGFSVLVQNPDIYNSMARILKSIEESFGGGAGSFEKIGIKENIPPQGIFITIPACIDGVIFNGNTTIYIPPSPLIPADLFDIPEPFPFDGITHIAAVIPDASDWHSGGIKINREIDYFTYTSPITTMFQVDMTTFTEFLNSMENMMPGNIPGMEDYQLPDIGGDSPFAGLTALINAMTSNAPVQGGKATVTITVDGVYTKFYGD